MNLGLAIGEQDLMRNSKCEMARQRYCRKSSMGCCNLDDDKLDRCPYLQAIGEITKKSVENSKYESNQEKLKEWIEDYKKRDKLDMVLMEEVVSILEEFVVD